MELRIRINLEGKAFANPTEEVARILRVYASLITRSDGKMDQPLRDPYGNTVGQAEVVSDEDAPQ